MLSIIYPFVCLSIYSIYKGVFLSKSGLPPPNSWHLYQGLTKKMMRSEIWVFFWKNLHSLSSCSPSTNNRTNSSTHKLSVTPLFERISPSSYQKQPPLFGRSKNTSQLTFTTPTPTFHNQQPPTMIMRKTLLGGCRSRGQFLQKAKAELEKSDFPELRTVGSDTLMYLFDPPPEGKEKSMVEVW